MHGGGMLQNFRLNIQTGHLYFDDGGGFPRERYRIAYWCKGMTFEYFNRFEMWESCPTPDHFTAGMVFRPRERNSSFRPLSAPPLPPPDPGDPVACAMAVNNQIEVLSQLFPGYVWKIITSLPMMPLSFLAGMTKSPWFEELIMSNYTLVLCALHGSFENTGGAGVPCSADSFARTKRRDLLRRAFSIDSPRLIRLLEAVRVPPTVDVMRLREVVTGVAADNAALEFYSRFNYIPFSFLMLYRYVALLKQIPLLASGSSLFDSASEYGTGDDAADRLFATIADCIAMAEAAELSLRKKPWKLSRCSSVAMVNELHDRLVVYYNGHRDKLDLRRFINTWGTDQFPQPPFAGDDRIVPISSLPDRKNEGKMMHHCVGMYGPEVMKGESYIYKVLTPERATLEVKKNATTGTWGIEQLFCACNKLPLDVTKRVVRQWLERAQSQQKVIAPHMVSLQQCA